MGLFGGSSKSSSTTRYEDNSTNMSVDLSGGDLSQGASKNIIATGDVNVDGLSEDLAGQIFGFVGDAYNGAISFVGQAIGNNDNKTQKTVETISTSLQQAYNSEASTISSFKTFALYGLIGLIAYAYLKRK